MSYLLRCGCSGRPHHLAWLPPSNPLANSYPVRDARITNALP